MKTFDEVMQTNSVINNHFQYSVLKSLKLREEDYQDLIVKMDAQINYLQELLVESEAKIAVSAKIVVDSNGVKLVYRPPEESLPVLHLKTPFSEDVLEEIKRRNGVKS